MDVFTTTITNKADFIDCFREIEDMRDDDKLLYPLDEVLFLTVSAVLSYAESWRQIYEFGKAKLEFLRQYFPYKHGIPKKSRICTLIGMIDKKKFESWLIKWAQQLVDIIPKDIISVDGKAAKGSRTKENTAVHMLNVFASKQGLVIGQKAIDSKTNEMKEIPKILDDLSIKGATVTIDAAGCYSDIIDKVVEKEADYFIRVKANQPQLLDAIKYIFKGKVNASTPDMDYHSQNNKGHGRKECRRCWGTTFPDWLKDNYSKWNKLNSVYLVESERHIGDKISIEQKFYISSIKFKAKRGLECSRTHWGIENQLHHVLDVTFKEDHSQIHNAAENMSIIRKVALNLAKLYKSNTKSKSSIPSIRKQTSWSTEVASNVLSYLFAKEGLAF